jgi:hypothetical protein
MKKYFLFTLILSLILIWSCEKDDICLENTTPKLILKFYDINNDTLAKSVTSLTSWANDLDTIYLNEAVDSIIVPLNLNLDKTNYKLISSNVIDTLYLSYERNDLFISRSCGYKTIFENVEIDSISNNWIKGFNINNTIIDNDTTAHINIFH